MAKISVDREEFAALVALRDETHPDLQRRYDGLLVDNRAKTDRIIAVLAERDRLATEIATLKK